MKLEILLNGDEMSTFQRRMLVLSFSFTFIILYLNYFYRDILILRFLKLWLICTLFIASACAKKYLKAQIFMSQALFFAALGDFFYVIGELSTRMPHILSFLGTFCFFISYLNLIKAFYIKSSCRIWKIISSLPLITLSLPIIPVLLACVPSNILWGIVFFGLTLCFMSLCLINTLFYGFYSFFTSLRIAIAGYLIMLSDILVCLVAFHPVFSHQNIWLETVIWIFFIGSWTLILVTIIDNKLYIKKPTE